MSSLFGHKKGSFTGALKDRDGLLKTADNGILFLDEIGELGLDEQSMLLRAIEEKCFLPLGSDHEVSSDFQLICGTNRDLYQDIIQGRFRDDLYARINLWTFEMPGLKERPEDIEPNLSYELDRYFEKNGRRITFNKEAKTRFLSFAESPGAIWSGNFRDLNGALVRMSTLAKSGRITDEVVIPEINRLKQSWKRLTPDHDMELISEFMTDEDAEKLDLFDRIQLAGVLKVCRESKTISDAGRTLYAKSRVKKRNRNDADRLKKYLGKFNISFPN
jgi:transcriptional regulatory protein RtcR